MDVSISSTSEEVQSNESGQTDSDTGVSISSTSEEVQSTFWAFSISATNRFPLVQLPKKFKVPAAPKGAERVV